MPSIISYCIFLKRKIKKSRRRPASLSENPIRGIERDLNAKRHFYYVNIKSNEFSKKKAVDADPGLHQRGEGKKTAEIFDGGIQSDDAN